MRSRFHDSSSLLLMFVLEEPPCLSLACSILLKSPARIQFASGNSTWAKWFQSMALGPVRLNPYTLRIPIMRCVLSWRNTYCARPGYKTPCWITIVLTLSETMIHVPPVNLAVRAEKVASFHKLEPPLNSMSLACLR